MNPDHIVHLEPTNERAMTDLKDAIEYAMEHGRSLKLTTEGQTLRLKVDGFTWSLPYQSDH